MKNPLRGRAPGPTDEVAQLRRRVNRLAARVTELEQEMQESRRLNRRLAEVTDVVTELLVPLSQRDEAKVRALVDRYAKSL